LLIVTAPKVVSVSRLDSSERLLSHAKSAWNPLPIIFPGVSTREGCCKSGHLHPNFPDSKFSYWLALSFQRNTIRDAYDLIWGRTARRTKSTFLIMKLKRGCKKIRRLFLCQFHMNQHPL